MKIVCVLLLRVLTPHGGLFLHQAVDDLLAVLTITAVADVYPVAARLGVLLPDELVEVAVFPYPLEPPLTLLYISVDAQVGCLSSDVLRAAYTSHRCIELR